MWGSTSVACWLLVLLKVSVLSRISKDGGLLLPPPFEPESELELDFEPQVRKARTSPAAQIVLTSRRTKLWRDNRDNDDEQPNLQHRPATLC